MIVSCSVMLINFDRIGVNVEDINVLSAVRVLSTLSFW